MARYQNGKIPASILVHMGGEHYATPATKARIEALIADIKKNEGVTVSVTPGRNIYRDYASQVSTKQWAVNSGRPWLAATPGLSSHGGTMNGKDCLAVDFSGYAALGLDKWFAYLRKHGFEANYYDGKNGRPLEPWHAIDWDPYATPKPASTPSKPTTQPAVVPEEEDDDMKNCGFYYTRASDKAVVVLIANFGSGIYHEYSNGKTADGTYNGPIAATTGTGSYAPITESHARVIKAACDKAKNLSVAVIDAA